MSLLSSILRCLFSLLSSLFDVSFLDDVYYFLTNAPSPASKFRFFSEGFGNNLDDAYGAVRKVRDVIVGNEQLQNLQIRWGKVTERRIGRFLSRLVRFVSW